MNGNTSATLARILLSKAGSMMLIVVPPSLREKEKQQIHEEVFGDCKKSIVNPKSESIQLAQSAGKQSTGKKRGKTCNTL